MALARAASSNNDGLDDLESMDVTTIVDKIIKLKGQLKIINEKSERPVNIEGKGCTCNYCPSHDFLVAFP